MSLSMQLKIEDQVEQAENSDDTSAGSAIHDVKVDIVDDIVIDESNRAKDILMSLRYSDVIYLLNILKLQRARHTETDDG